MMKTEKTHSSLPLDHAAPLAERMRPKSIEDVFGQEKLLTEGKLLRELINSGSIPSLLLWGPPGTGKTTLAHVISQATSSHFVFFSAVLSGVKEIREIVTAASQRLSDHRKKTLLFVDEIHRFNKTQQDAFLPHVESGLITLIGATTENPSFQVVAPLLSRCRVLVLEPLSLKTLISIIYRALEDKQNGLGNYPLHLDEKNAQVLAGLADGDARRCLNILEVAATLALKNSSSPAEQNIISRKNIEEASQNKFLRYDHNGEEHYNLISALHKSLRDSDPDGALYWFYRMMEAGEDPLYISRRLTRFASEDVGAADPHALVQANASRSAYQALGSPEGDLALAQTVVYLATAPKSNALYSATKAVKKTINKTGTLPVPLHIRNAPTRLMRELGYGKDYKYAHDYQDGVVDQDHLPEELSGSRFYNPTNRGYESIISDRLKKWRNILKSKNRNKK